jgi:hypothetical protein
VTELTGFADMIVACAVRREVTDLSRGYFEKSGARRVVLVEGVSDRAALDALASRYGRRLETEGIFIVPMGGATSIGRFLRLLGPEGFNVPVAGLCDAGEENFFRRSLENAGLGSKLTREGMQDIGFYVCKADLESELIRAVGSVAAQDVIQSEGDMKAFRTFQRQPYQRQQTIEQQLRRFFGTLSGRKERYARALATRVDLASVPRPLRSLLTTV